MNVAVYSFMSGTLLCCTVLYFFLYCIVLRWVGLYCIVLYCTVLSCIALLCFVLHCIALYCISLFCGVLYCIVLFCIVWYAFLMSLMSNYWRRSTAAILPDSYNAMSLWLGTAGLEKNLDVHGDFIETMKIDVVGGCCGHVMTCDGDLGWMQPMGIGWISVMAISWEFPLVFSDRDGLDDDILGGSSQLQ